MDSALVKDNYKTQHSATIEDAKNIYIISPEESEAQYNFQGQSERSRHWFDLDPGCIKGNFMTREPDFFPRLYLKSI